MKKIIKKEKLLQVIELYINVEKKDEKSNIATSPCGVGKMCNPHAHPR